ncbi:pimeloyl-ACP methyl esterase BioG family protein [Helicobacter turcicus]|uniref:DUF452 family protein n=1 Tax=Helicobacter turcicus TaxID=2867412 RepID=A0ABS7JNR1_9HELI|nr:pimeloyl-ACP methyl esterase BioG family protein [Helicobacter turcicus]MBX7491050.1 DUF452 family protein [Helicobacter turcicus]MBX7546311.1 DUF452 family protein [Helicobacter turcicus]
MQLFKALNNKKEIILFFGGFGAHPSHFLPFIPKHCDALVLHHYAHLDFNPLLETLHSLPKDSKITLIAFSMGVFVARIFLNTYAFKPHKIIAINGTEYGIQKDYGIPPALFRRTYKHFATNGDLALKHFKSNLFSEHLDKAHNFVFLDSNTLCAELAFFMESCATHSTLLVPISWDFAVVSLRDLIFSPQAQNAFWQSTNTKTIPINAPHFAFFDWNL